MINPTGVDQLTRKIAEQSLKEAEKQPQEANAGDQARFNEALQKTQSPAAQNAQPADPLQQQTATAAASGVAPAGNTAVAPAHSAGDSILHGLDKLRAENQQMTAQVEPGTDPKQLSPQELLSMQAKVSGVMIDDQMVTSGTSKATQNIDTLLKSQ
jgi:hypothetical protein